MAQLHTFLTGFAVGESPRWHDGRLWFADWGESAIVAVDAKGEREIIVRMPSFPFCFDWLPDGRMLIVSGREGQILCWQPGQEPTVYADLTKLAKTPWKDIVVDGRGNAYIGNIGFNFPQEQFKPGILALVTPDGAARQVADGVAFPHGMVVTPDNSTLIVAEAYASQLAAFDIAADGSLKNQRVWADLSGQSPHGICFDAEGAVWYSDIPNQQCVRVREGGNELEVIDLDRSCFACTLGGEDGKTLFMVTSQWQGAQNMTSGPQTGQIVTANAPATGAVAL